MTLFKSMASALLAVFLMTSVAGAMPGGGAMPVEDGKPATPPPDIADIKIDMTVPLFSEHFAKIPVALVNDEPVTLEELNESLASLHEGMQEGRKTEKQNFSEILDRLITVKLILQESRNMELDKVPESKRPIDAFAAKLLRETLMLEAVKNVLPDEKDVEKAYKDKAREWKVKSLVFAKEEDAKKAAEEIKKGKSFDEVYAAAVEAKTAEGKDSEFVPRAALHPATVKAFASMKTGEVSTITPLQKGFLMVRLDGERVPLGNIALRDEVFAQQLTAARYRVLEKYKEDLIKKHVKQDTKLFKSLDFEAKKPGVAKLLKDQRVVATIKGGKKITVADITQALADKFFHGIDQAIESKKVNKSKAEILDQILSREALAVEAKARGIDQSEEYKKKVADYESSILFGTFVEKVVRPGLSPTEEEIKAFYDAHVADFTRPAMVKLDTIIFQDMAQATSAVDKLRQGMDFKWFQANAEGRIDPEKDHDALHFHDKVMSVTELPEGVQRAIENAGAEEFRPYQGDGRAYVLYIKEFYPAAVQPLPEVEVIVSKKVHANKINAAIEDWAKKLRAASDVKVFARFGQK